jgi:hypothetical protein
MSVIERSTPAAVVAALSTRSRSSTASRLALIECSETSSLALIFQILHIYGIA